MYNFETFELRQMIASSQTLRHLGLLSRSMEEAAGEISDFFFESFRSPEGEPACALVRCFKTHTFNDLPETLQAVARDALKDAGVNESMPCLTLLSTRGIKPEWNSRHTSLGHRAIPLATAQMIAQAPMIANLVLQMGLQLSDVLNPTEEKRDVLESRTLDVFHIEHASGSAFVPAQATFIELYGIQSVLGFGGMLPTGELFFVIIFTKVPVSSSTAALFRTLALSAKLVLLKHMDEPLFSR